MARREHHRIARLDAQSAKRALMRPAPTEPILSGAAGGVWAQTRRPGAENGPSKSAPSKMEQMPAAVINGLIPCHVSLRVHVDAAGRSTPHLMRISIAPAASPPLAAAPWSPPGESCLYRTSRARRARETPMGPVICLPVLTSSSHPISGPSASTRRSGTARPAWSASTGPTRSWSRRDRCCRASGSCPTPVSASRRRRSSPSERASRTSSGRLRPRPAPARHAARRGGRRSALPFAGPVLLPGCRPGAHVGDLSRLQNHHLHF